MKQLKRYIFYVVLFTLLIPLTLKTEYFLIYTWNLGACLLIAYSLLNFNKLLKIKKFNTWEVAVISLIIILIISTLLGDNTFDNLPILGQYISALLFGIYARREWGRKLNFRVLFIFFTIILISQSIIGLIQQITLSNFGNPQALFGVEQEQELKTLAFTESFSRVKGTLGQPNIMGNWLLLAIPFVYVSFCSIPIKRKRIWLFLRKIGLILGFIALGLTLSRGNIILGVISIAFIIYYRRFIFKYKYPVNTKKLIINFIIIIIVSYIIIRYSSLLLLPIEFLAIRFRELLDPTYETAGTYRRLEMMKGALQSMIQNPLLGVGFNNSPQIWSSVSVDLPLSKEYRPHNIFLLIGVEGGFIAFISYLLVIFIPLGKAIRGFYNYKKDILGSAFLIALILSVGFMFLYSTPISGGLAPLLFLIMGSSIGYFDQRISLLKKKK